MRRLPATKRTGFTLIELIIVITILVVIASLTIGAIGKSFTWIRQKNTEQTMTKVALRFERVIQRLAKEVDDWPSTTENMIMDQAAGSFERARVLKLLYLYKWNFPNTYAEAYHNVQESRQLYDNRIVNTANPADFNNFPGYPPAKALLNKLRANNPGIPDPFAFPFNARQLFDLPVGTEVYSPWPGGTPLVANMAREIPLQSSACMLAAFTTANGSPDEFSSDEVVVDASGTDRNPRLVDNWGTPLLFLRHGNFIYSRHRVGTGGVDRAAWSMGMIPNTVSDPVFTSAPFNGVALNFAPLEFVLNPNASLPPNPGTITSHYFQQLQLRANSSFSNLAGSEPFDPTGLLKSNQQWRSNSVPTGAPPPVPTWNSWLWPARTPWLADQGAGNQNVTLFRRTFGYMPEELTPLGVPNQAFCPMVILSAGGDKIFSTWDDNLDSYRLKINVSGQQ